MRWLYILYGYIWYFTEFTIRKTHLRRPFTFIMRDHPWIFWALVTPALGLATFLAPKRFELLPACFWSMLFAHLWWGSQPIPGQQEEPCFDPLHPIRSTDRKGDKDAQL